MARHVDYFVLFLFISYSIGRPCLWGAVATGNLELVKILVNDYKFDVKGNATQEGVSDTILSQCTTAEMTIFLLGIKKLYYRYYYII